MQIGIRRRSRLLLITNWLLEADGGGGRERTKIKRQAQPNGTPARIGTIQWMVSLGVQANHWMIEELAFLTSSRYVFR